MTQLAERITVDLEQCGGRPCVRGMRIRVVDVLDLLADGLSRQDILEELPTTSSPAFASPDSASTTLLCRQVGFAPLRISGDARQDRTEGSSILWY